MASQVKIHHLLKDQNFIKHEWFRCYIRESGIPYRFMDSDIPIDQERDPKQSYFFYGGVGCGKTHESAALLRRICAEWVLDPNTDKRVPPVLFVSVPDLLLEIKATYEGIGSESEVVEKYANIPYLILDDMGAEKTTEWVIQTMYVIVNHRYQESKHLIVTSNYPISQLRSKLDDRIASRLSELCVSVSCGNKDRRAK